MESLPISWVDRIFDKLTVTYGKAFAGQYEGIAPETVKANWAQELARYAKRPEAIKWALENLPAKAPNVVEFRALCRDAPNPDVFKLPPPGVVKVPEKVLEALAVIGKGPLTDKLAWAKSIIGRHERGEKVSPTSLRMARQALERGTFK